MPIDSGNLALKGLDDLFSTEENRQDEQREQVQQIPIDALHPFTNHPFKVLDDEAMTRTVESIAQYGVLAPLIARPRPEGGYEIISGHRRQYAATVTGFFSVMHMAMKHELGSAEPYFAATSPVLDLTVIRPDDAPHILACFDEADEGIGISENEPLGFRYNPKQVVKLMGQRYLVGPVIFHRFDEDGNFASLTMGDMYTIQKYLEAKSVTLMIDRDKLTCICID